MIEVRRGEAKREERGKGEVRRGERHALGYLPFPPTTSYNSLILHHTSHILQHTNHIPHILYQPNLSTCHILHHSHLTLHPRTHTLYRSPSLSRYTTPHHTTTYHHSQSHATPNPLSRSCGAKLCKIQEEYVIKSGEGEDGVRGDWLGGREE